MKGHILKLRTLTAIVMASSVISAFPTSAVKAADTADYHLPGITWQKNLYDILSRPTEEIDAENARKEAEEQKAREEKKKKEAAIRQYNDLHKYSILSQSCRTLTRSSGRFHGPSGSETYYDLDMSGCIRMMRRAGNTDPFWVREDGVKMLGPYVMCAADLSVRPRGSIINTSLGKAIVVDTGAFASADPYAVDIAVSW